MAIEVKSLRKSYGSAEVVRGIDLTVAPGEIVAVLGPNGAGKTTTVEILEGLTPRSSGEVRVLGVDPERAGTDFRERVGVMLQDSAPEPYLSVRELLELHRSLYRRARSTRALLQLVELEDRADVRVRKLSGGQQRRLDLALALVGDPELLFLDEPTTGFDPAARRRAWDVIATLQDSGTTIVLTTHYLEEAEALADRVVVLLGGAVVAEGPPGSVGNRLAGPSLVSFAPVPGHAPGDLPVPVEVVNRAWVVRSDDPTETLHLLTGWAMQREVRLTGLTVAPPSLQDVYLEVVS